MHKVSFIVYFVFILSLLSISACKNSGVSTPSSSAKTPTVQQDSNVSTEAIGTENKLQKELDILEAQKGNSNRTIWQRPRMIIQRLGDLSDKTVADIGAGPFGYFSFQLVNEAKKVIAIDINETALAFIDSIRTDVLSESKQDALETRQSSPNNPNLKPDETDVIILMNVYAYLPDQISYLKTLKRGLTKNGKLLIVDFKMRNLPLGPPQEEKVPLFIVEQNLKKAGFEINSVDDRTLDYQYMVIASKE